MVQVFKSKFTKGVGADEVNFAIGEVVQYRLKSGKVLDIKIDSELMTHQECEGLGYESIFSDDNRRYFALRRDIINWNGRVE